MTLSPTEMQQLRSALPALTTTLKHFSSSSQTFKLLTTITSSSPFPPSFTTPPNLNLPAPKTLYILDSSFNPPTLAHARILLNALSNSNSNPNFNSESTPTQTPKRILLLLATQNADKAPKPASFEQRIQMMSIFAREILSTLSSPSPSTSPSTSPQTENEIAIDLGLTSLPYFHDKSASIQKSTIYPKETTQIHLLGYDTLIRLLDTKYYAPSHSLSVLSPFLSKHKLLVTYRPSSTSSAEEFRKERKEQDDYLRRIGEGERKEEGAERKWVTDGRIKMVEGRKEGDEVISSTRVRGAVKAGDNDVLGRLVGEGVKEWMLNEGLYLE